MRPLIRARLGAVRSQTQLVRSHPSNCDHRLKQVVQVVRFEFNSLRGRSALVTFSDGLVVRASKGGNSSARAAFTRLPDWPEMLIWRAWLRPGDTFLDVGANVGLYSLVAAETGADVIAVEPAADMVEMLRENIQLNGFDSISIHQVALMDRPGTVELVGPDPNRRVASHREGAQCTPAVTIDELIGGRVLRGIKVDVEGNERLVLEGASRLLGDGRVELIQLEWNSTSEDALGEDRAPVASLLLSAGFSLFQSVGDAEMVSFGPGEAPPYGRDVFAARGQASEMLRQHDWLSVYPV